MKSLEASESVHLIRWGARPPCGGRIVSGPATRCAYHLRVNSALTYRPWVEDPSYAFCPAPFVVPQNQDPTEFWTDPTRLETRTKESDMCASIRVANPNAKRNRVSVRSPLKGCTTGSALYLLIDA